MQPGPLTSRPMVVTFAVILLTLGMTIRLLHEFSGARVHNLVVYLMLAVVVGTPYLIIWFIFLGKNWARWVFFVVFGLALYSLSRQLQEFLSLPVEEIVVYSAQTLLGAVAAVALLSSTAANWFRAKKNDTKH